jgi:hypothetical protein
VDAVALQRVHQSYYNSHRRTTDLGNATQRQVVVVKTLIANLSKSLSLEQYRQVETSLNTSL